MWVTIRADCNKQLARPYIDSGCIRVQDRQLVAPSFRFLRHWLLRAAGRMPEARIKSKLPIEIVVEKRRTSSHICTQTPDPRFPVGLQHQAPMSAVAVAVIRPAPTLLSLTRVPLHPVWPTPVARFPGPFVIGVRP